ncbi:MAG: DUF3107 domain-containing protein [Corynebacterium sp.]|nr:DUF3107 domain-containing protein [Corynebacterium sp.]
MDITIGLERSGREISFSSNAADDVVAHEVEAALTGGEGIFSLTDEKGNTISVRRSAIAYVRVGSANTRHVGFQSS